MTDLSDSESDLEIVSSQEGFEQVPEDKDYRMKIVTENKNIKVQYTLKKYNHLPYNTKLCSKIRGLFLILNTFLLIYSIVFDATFSRSLVPSIEGYVGQLEDNGWWVFSKGGS